MNPNDIAMKLQALMSQFPWGPSVLMILSCVGSLVVVASLVVMLTPTKVDDAMLEKLEKGHISGIVWNVLKWFSLLKSK